MVSPLLMGPVEEMPLMVTPKSEAWAVPERPVACVSSDTPRDTLSTIDEDAVSPASPMSLPNA